MNKNGLFLSWLVFFFVGAVGLSAQINGGTYERTTAFDGKEIKYVLMVSGDYFSWTAYYSNDGQFIATKGGSHEVKSDKLYFNYEFDTADTAMVGRSESHNYAMKGKNLTIDNVKWKLVDAGKNSPIDGPWLISGRKRGDEIVKRNTDRPRKTMKILTATRFQWIAYNVATKQFMGTGGGTYTAENGKYIENIEFFSRDKSRVGASLDFMFEVKNGDWHHSGKSSKGDPIYEVWSKRSK